ncbi:sodium/hydrogen exchanger family-like protein [Fragilaria crotonensis]|nr:sodium/hydrogen exchanger family-like protein [Fragilaria crotonensis]
MESTRITIRRILEWQKKRGVSLITAAALTLSVLFCSQQTLDSYVRPGHLNQPEVHTVQRQALAARGGRTQAPSKRALVMTESIVGEAMETTSRSVQEAMNDLFQFMKGPKSDTLLLLMATSLITPFCKRLGISPILGFLGTGMLVGPYGNGLITGIHTTEILAELAGAVAGVGSMVGLPANALVVLGGGIALSSSAFVLQLLKDKNQLATRFGKASFGVLLFQDLAVVPLLVVTPILAGSGTGLVAALGSAVLKAGMALGAIAVAGRYLVNPLFKTVAEARSQEAFLGVILLTVLSMSFMTEGLGLSNTLGAFLAGVLLSETKYRHQVEADIAPFRGILLGLFFITVGFEIDVGLIVSKFPLIASIVMGIIGVKAAVATSLSLAFGLSLSTSQQTGLLLSQGGEFAFVAFGLARSLGIFDAATTKILLTSVSLTMALTPALASLGAVISKQLEEKTDFSHYLGQDSDAVEIKESDDFAVVVGYGVVGKVVCDLLDRKFIKYVGLEIDPNKAIQARNKGLPVFFGDIGRPEVAQAFNVGKSRCVIVCISDKEETNRAVISLRREYPNLKIFCRAKDADHAQRLQKTLDVAAMIPILPEDNFLLTLPFGGAVLKSLGVSAEETNSILESKRKEMMSGRGLRDGEEEATLLQLGIMVDSSTSDSASPKNDEQSPTEAAAAAQVEKMEIRSPMLASIIEANCPGAVIDIKSTEINGEGTNVTVPVAVDVVE